MTRKTDSVSNPQKAEESFEVEWVGEGEATPIGYGYTYIPNYFIYFWTPLIGLKAADTYKLLCSFAHNREDECSPSIELLADTLGVDRRDLTGRMRRDHRSGSCREYYQKGTLEILAEHGLIKITTEERGGTKHYRFKVLKPPLLTPDQISGLSEELQRMHQKFLENVSSN